MTSQLQACLSCSHWSPSLDAACNCKLCNCRRMARAGDAPGSLEQTGKGQACFKCGEAGHWAKDCPVGRSEGAAPVQVSAATRQTDVMRPELKSSH